MATPENTKTKPAPVASVPAQNGPKADAPASAAAKPAEAAKPPTEAKATDDDGEEKKERGAIPNMPVCAIWRDPKTQRVTAALIHPRGGEYRIEGKGIGGTTGALMDEGYPIGGIRIDGPKWVEKRIPEGVEVLGFANVQGFPLPPQSNQS